MINGLQGLVTITYDLLRRPCAAARGRSGAPGVRRVVAALVLLGGPLIGGALLAGCSYRGPADTFLGQRATWFSYLNGDDLRAACRPGAPERLRLVYNADFSRQARTYDVVPAPDGGAVVQQSVAQGLTLSGAELLDPLSIGAPRRGEARLTAAERADLEARLQASGAFDSPPRGLRLNSADTWWLVTGCRGGAYFLTAFVYPSARFAAIRFAEPLVRRDTVAVPIAPPTAARFDPERRCQDRGSEGYVCFSLEVGADGLVGITTID